MEPQTCDAPPVGNGVGAPGVSGSLSEDCREPLVVLPFPLPEPLPVPVPLTLPVPWPIPRPVLPVGVCWLLARPRPCASG